jgi:phospholipid/cholesterol/gamma-HCH transport system substrate-binding protein
MKDQRKTEIKVGIMTVAGVIVFIWVLSWAKNFSFTSTDKELLVKFKDVSGLEIGNYVTVNGVRKGYVEDFNISGDYVFVKLRINNDVKLKKDARFSVAMLDLMGGKKIDVRPGYSNEALDFNKVQSGDFYADIPTVMAMIGNVQDDLVSAIKDVNITLKSVNSYLTDDQLSKNIKSSAANLSELSSKINLMLDENRSNIKVLTANAVDLTKDAKDFLNTNKDGINNSVKDLQALLKKTDTLLTNVNRFSDQLNDKDNNLNKLLHDKEMYNNLTQSVKQLKDLTNMLIEQLKNEGIKVDANIDLF